MRSLLILLVLSASAHASETTFSLTGQGIFRRSEVDCKAAGAAISAKLSGMGFKVSKTDCAKLADDEAFYFVPTFEAKHSSKYSMDEQKLGTRRYGTDAERFCKEDLAGFVKDLKADEVLEADCIKGNELNPPREYLQAQVAVLRKEKSAVKESEKNGTVDSDARRKGGQTSAKSAPSAEGKATADPALR